MARSITEIQNDIVKRINAAPELVTLTSTSKVAVWKAITYVIAVCIWTLETLFDLHKEEVIDIITNMKRHNVQWYAVKAKDFQFGYDLLPDSDLYDNSQLSDEEIAKSKVISHSAVIEQLDSRGIAVLRIKVATKVGDELQALQPEQLTAFKEFMSRVKDAGVKLQIDSLPPDSLKLQLNIYYNPLVLSNNGSRLDGTQEAPVKTAIKDHLEGLPFNGMLTITFLIDTLQKVEGVVIPTVVNCSARYGNLPFQSVDVEYQPDAGYLRILAPEDLIINYIPKSVS